MKVSILGFGRFGKTLYRLLQKDFEIVIFDVNKDAYKDCTLSQKTTIAKTVAEAYNSKVIFYCVPISTFEEIVLNDKKYINSQLLIDTLSVKVHPKKVLTKALKNSQATAILTHPMFGPDSSKLGFNGLPLVMDKFTATDEQFKFWKEHFQKQGLKIVEITADEHDKLAAKSQGITHFIGRILEQFGFTQTPIDTMGAKKLQELMQQTCNDTWELFLSLQRYNPYTKEMRTQFENAFDNLNYKIIPDVINPEKPVYGIQGGVGSFNDQALIEMRGNIAHEVKYLYTSENVLKNLREGNIDYGLLAVHNSLGGIVEESLQAMSKSKFKILEKHEMKIRHFLMKRKDVRTDELTTIMAHPQVLKQCHDTLAKKYPKLKTTSGVDELVDTAKAAEALSNLKIPSNTAILGPERLSAIYDFEIIAKDLQDNANNITTFILICRQ